MPKGDKRQNSGTDVTYQLLIFTIHHIKFMTDVLQNAVKNIKKLQLCCSICSICKQAICSSISKFDQTKQFKDYIVRMEQQSSPIPAEKKSIGHAESNFREKLNSRENPLFFATELDVSSAEVKNRRSENGEKGLDHRRGDLLMHVEEKS